MSDTEGLGAWALDALDGTEQVAVDELVAAGTDPEVAGEARALRAVVARLAEPHAESPPDDLRARVLARVRAAPRPVEAAPPATVYARGVARLEHELRRLGPGAERGHVSAYGWTVHGLVAHLAEVERYFAAVIGIDGGGGGATRAGSPADHLSLGGDPTGPDSPPLPPFADLVDAWAATAERAVDHVGALSEDELEQRVAFHGLPMRRSTLLVVRGFELWTHADDVRRAERADVEAPPPDELHAMADRAVGGLPGLLLLQGEVAPAGARARIVLTGAGGGTWDLDLAPGEGLRHAGHPAVVLVADVVDWCRMAARRLPPAELALVVEGDDDLARQLVAAAQAVAF